MATLKKLPLPAWVSLHFNLVALGRRSPEAELLKEDASLPVYSDGWYYDRKAKKSWYCLAGKAYAYFHPQPETHQDISSFEFHMQYASARIMRDEEAAALETLIKNGFPLPKEVRAQYDAFRVWQQFNSFASRDYRRMKKDAAAARRRFQAFKASRGL